MGTCGSYSQLESPPLQAAQFITAPKVKSPFSPAPGLHSKVLKLEFGEIRSEINLFQSAREPDDALQ